jgi:ATP-dependent helicase/nuclease subunit A
MTADRESHDERDRDLAATDLSRNYVVEASAGTGKTTVLVRRILNLITEEKASPEEIVAITFTDRAAAELKAKIQEELSKSLAAASGEVRDHIGAALWSFERMHASTIHSFCASLIRERPVEAGVDPNFEVADALRSSLIASEVWDEWLSREMDKDDPVMRQAVVSGVTLDKMYSLAAAMRENRDLLGHLPRSIDRNRVLGDYRSALLEGSARLEQMRKKSCTDDTDKAAQAIHDLRRLAREVADAEKPDRLQELVLEGFPIKWQSRWGSKTRWDSPGVLEEVRSGIGALKDSHQKAMDSIGHAVLAELAGKLNGYIRAYEEAKREQQVLDFQDLLISTRDMLARHPEVRSYFGKRFKHILVDEFQDTDPLQAEIIFLLSEAEPAASGNWRDVKPTPGKIFLVGDPKQSIYRFRRADIEMYAAARDKLGANSLLSISRNFRCAPSITATVNAMFGDLIAPSEDGRYQPAYVPLHTGRQASKLPSRHGVVMLYPPQSSIGKLTDAQLRRTYEARCIAAFTHRILSEQWPIWDKNDDRERPVKPRDIAVLMETHYPLPYLEEAFGLYEVDYRVIGGRHFFHRQEVQQIVMVLRSIDNPFDRVALIAALRSPFFGVSDEDIFRFHSERGDMCYLDNAAGTALEEPFAVLGTLHDIRNDVTVQELLCRLYVETRAPVTYLLKPGGDQRVANLLKIADAARAMYERGLCTFRGFVAWLSEREATESEEAEALTTEPTDDFVRILTMHKAKGLEFPVVILSDLAKGPHKGTEEIITDRTNQEVALSLGTREGLRTLNFDGLSEYEKKRCEAEKIRLLYVSMTRARDLLVIPAYWIAPTELGKGGDLPTGSFIEILRDHIPQPEGGQLPGLLDGSFAYDTASLDLEPKVPPPFRMVLAERSGKPTQLKEAASERHDWRASVADLLAASTRGIALRSATEGEALPDRIPAAEEEPGGAAFGSLIHRILETIDWTNPHNLGALVKKEAENAGATPQMLEAAVGLVERTLRSDLIRRILAADRYFKEVPFTFKENGTIVEGVIDVLFEEGGKIAIVDFKTDRVPKARLAERVAAYRQQIDTYRRAVSEACGRPPEEVILFFLHPMEALRGVNPQGR